MAQLGGINGFGKTSFIRSISTGVYGESSGILLSNIANDINGNCIVSVALEVKGEQWRIERGFSPNFVKVYRGDNEKPEEYGGIDAVKNKIKKEIIDLPYYIFSSILSLSVDDFKSFLTMKSQDAKNIRDRIFGFYVINEIFDKVKDELNTAEKEYATMDTKLVAKEENLTYLKQQLETAKETAGQGVKQKMLELKKEFDKLKAESAELKTKITEATQANEGYRQDKANADMLAAYKFNLEVKKQMDGFKLKVEDADKQILEMEQEYTTAIKGQGEYERYLKFVESQKAAKQVILLEAEQATVEEWAKKISYHNTASNYLASYAQLELDQAQLATLDAWLLKNTTNLDNAAKAANKLSEHVTIMKQDKRTLEGRIALHEAGKCPTCETDLTDDAHKQELVNDKARLDKINTDLPLAEKKLTELKGNIESAKPVVAKKKSAYDVLENKIQGSLSFLAGKEKSTLEEMLKDNDITGVDVEDIAARKLSIPGQLEKMRAKLVDYVYEKEVKAPDQAAIDLLENNLANKRMVTLEDKNKVARLSGTLKPVPEDFDPEVKILFVEHDSLIDANDKLISADTVTYRVGVNRLKAIQEESNELKNNNSNEQVKQITNMIAEAETGIETFKEEIEAKKKYINYKRAQKFTLSDEGIKSHIIKEFVPYINSNIQRLLAYFPELNLNLYFDAEFKAHIFRHGKEVALNTTSTGQKKILNFVILITMTKILKLKYPDINLIFYDEIFSSIHPVNRTVILDIIEKEIKQELNMTVVVVSHSHLPDSYFDQKLEVYKENNFSRLSISEM